MSDRPLRPAAVLNQRIKIALAGIALAGAATNEHTAHAASRKAAPKSSKLPPKGKPAPGKPEPRSTLSRAAFTKAKRQVSARPPGIPPRDLARLARLTTHDRMPKGLTGTQRKLLQEAVRSYRQGNPRKGATAMKRLMAALKSSGKGKLAPAAYGFFAYETTVAVHPGLNRVARQYAFEVRKQAEIRELIGTLRSMSKKASRAKAPIVRWSSVPAKNGSLMAARAAKKLGRGQLSREIAYHRSHLELSLATARMLEATFEGKGKGKGKGKATRAFDRALVKLGKAMPEVVDNFADADDQVIDNADEVIDEVIDNAEDAIDDVVDHLEDAVDDVVDDAEDAVDDVVDELEDAVDDVVDELEDSVDAVVEELEDSVDGVVDELEDSVDAVVEDAEDAVDEVEGAVADAVAEVQDNASGGQSDLEELLAIAAELSQQCIEEEDAAACEALAEVSAQLADALDG